MKNNPNVSKHMVEVYVLLEAWLQATEVIEIISRCGYDPNQANSLWLPDNQALWTITNKAASFVIKLDCLGAASLCIQFHWLDKNSSIRFSEQRVLMHTK